MTIETHLGNGFVAARGVCPECGRQFGEVVEAKGWAPALPLQVPRDVAAKVDRVREQVETEVLACDHAE